MNEVLKYYRQHFLYEFYLILLYLEKRHLKWLLNFSSSSYFLEATFDILEIYNGLGKIIINGVAINICHYDLIIPSTKFIMSLTD